MKECKHTWILKNNSIAVCIIPDCGASLTVAQSETILNEHAALLEALESLQYIDNGRCPQCGGKQYHKKGCYVAEAIRKAKGE